MKIVHILLLFTLVCTNAMALGINTAAMASDGKLKAGTSENYFNLGSEEAYVAWEHWHNRVGKVMAKRLNHASGRNLGIITLHITVKKDHSLTAEVTNCTNEKIRDACLESIQSLNGDPTLEFPSETKRNDISFDLSYKKALFVLPRNTFIKDDYERVNPD